MVSSPGKLMVGRSSTSTSETSIRSHEPTGVDNGKKTREQKDKHNKRCRESRKRKREEVDKMTKENREIRDENQKMKMELQEMNSAVPQLRKALQQKDANEKRLLQIISIMSGSGQNFSSVDELATWFTSQNYGQVGSNQTNLSANADAAGGPFSVSNPINDLFNCDPAAGSNQTNLSPYTAAAGPSSVENHLLKSPNPNNNLFSGGPAAVNLGVDASAPNPGHSTVPYLDLLFGAADGSDNAFLDYVLANGFPSGGNPSF